MNGDRQVLLAILISTIILLSFFVLVLTTPKPAIPIFPLWVVGENHEIPAPNMNISLGRAYSLFIGARNLMGKTEYCTVAAKLRDMSSLLPFSGNSSVPAKASPLPSVTDLSFTLHNNETWEEAFRFTISGRKNLTENSITIDSVTINGAFYSVALKSFSEADSSFYLQFFFELWLQDEQQGASNFSGVWVSSPVLRIGE